MKKLSILLTCLGLAFSVMQCAVFTSISTSSQSLDSVSTSVSTALGSISKSLGSISKSSATASDKTTLYKKDVEILVSFYGNQPEMADSMEEDIARIAARHGIADWQSYAGTYASIGKGLKLAGLSYSEVKKIALSSCPGKEELQDAILEGFGV